MKLRIGRISLESLTVRSSDASLQDTEKKTESETHVDIVERDGNRVIIRLREHHVIAPLSISIDISLTGRCKADPSLTDEDISAAVRTAGYPLFAKRSQIVAFVTEASVGVPIILPPCAEYLERNDDSSKGDSQP